MVKLIALYKAPPDPEEFDRHVQTVHAPLVRKYPGLLKLELTTITGASLGDTPYHLVAEMYFASTESLQAALASPAGRAVAKDLMSFAAPFVTVLVGEVQE